ncbi:hypothetical protein [Reticulibacter mediterranei]|uniref:hypothetical protein n=1 Tax=Reticulibacter mediterranei TaxID=2778369 RepID=UPI001C69032A|nr:hypothetical protein [Reticulibacter mediterranei]
MPHLQQLLLICLVGFPTLLLIQSIVILWPSLRSWWRRMRSSLRHVSVRPYLKEAPAIRAAIAREIDKDFQTIAIIDMVK